ncbi:MAG TPA: PIN domain-containing protein [Trueperaceae bacterium]
MNYGAIAFDADVLIYSAQPQHQLGKPINQLLARTTAELRLIGSVLLLPELLIKRQRRRNDNELALLAKRLSRLELLPVDQPTAELATALGATYSLRSLDALHLATAVHGRADRFITNNRKDFVPDEIVELEVVYPDQLLL